MSKNNKSDVSSNLQATWLLDKRSQERYLEKQMQTKAELTQTKDELPNLDAAIEKFSDELPQPALGQFDAATLARVQAGFPYRSIKSPHLD